MKLPSALIRYLTRCFTSSLKQNKDDPGAVKQAITNVVPHAFGNHTNCGNWYRSQSSEGEYVYESLPGGNSLSDLELCAALTKLFTRFANKADRLALCGSTQANESFNNTVPSKHPKAQHYAASDSFTARLAAAVGQRNVGKSYVLEVKSKASISPGKETQKYFEKRDNEMKRQREKWKTIEFKKRRLLDKKKKSSRNAAATNKEGITYMTDSEFKAALDFIGATAPDDHIEIVGAKLIVFDLETTGLVYPSEICQIAALYEGSEFNVYVVPCRGISASASAVTGLTVTAGELFLDDVRLDTTPPKIALLKFIQYLKEVSQEHGVILVAHNGFKLDTPVILRQIRQYELLQEFTSIVKGFSDTLPVFRKHLPERVSSKGKFSQGSLAQEYLGSDAIQGAHNALEDVRVLNRLINILGVTGDALKDQARTITDILKSQQMAAVVACNKATLECLKNGVSAEMRTKVAKAGINLEILETTFKGGSDNALASLLGEDVRGHPRVTKNKKVLQGIMLELQGISCENRNTN